MKTKFSILALTLLASNSYAASIGIFGDANTQASIISTSLGHTTTIISDYTQLSSFDVIWGLNGSNFSHLSNLSTYNNEIADYVQNGGVIVYHDRYVTGASTVLPGGNNFSTQRDFSDSIQVDVVDNTTTVTNGPGGVIGNTTLDNGSSSSHGFTTVASIDQVFTSILSNSNPLEIIDFTYQLGLGDVYYSTIPLDFYLNGSGQANFRNIYAPNVLSYAVELAAENTQTVPEPSVLILLALGAFGLSPRRLYPLR